MREGLPVGTDTPTATGATTYAAAAPEIDSETILNELEDIAEELYFEQAETAIANGAHYGAFIILTSALQYLAGLAHAKAPEIQEKQVRDFCRIYLPGYDAEAIYSSHRCGLFHRGVPAAAGKTRNVVITSQCPDAHDPGGKNGAVTLNDSNFLQDLREALGTLMKVSRGNPKVMSHCQYAYEHYRPVKFPVS